MERDVLISRIALPLLLVVATLAVYLQSLGFDFIAFDDDRYLPHPLLEALVQEGSLGKKTGVGIYDWSSGEKAERKLPGL